MNYKEKIEELDSILASLKSFKSELKKIDKLSERSRNTNFTNSTPRQIQNTSASLNFACMYLDKQHKGVWTLLRDSFLKTDTEAREYSPSGFHTYK